MNYLIGKQVKHKLSGEIMTVINVFDNTVARCSLHNSFTVKCNVDFQVSTAICSIDNLEILN